MKYLSIILIFSSLIIYSQDIKKDDLIGNWKFKSIVITANISLDSINKTLLKKGREKGFIIPDEYYKNKEEPNLIIEKDKFYSGNFLGADFWEISKNKILLYSKVHENLESYKKNTIGVIIKLANGNYYFSPFEIEIISVNENELIIKNEFYNNVYEKIK